MNTSSTTNKPIGHLITAYRAHPTVELQTEIINHGLTLAEFDLTPCDLPAALLTFARACEPREYDLNATDLTAWCSLLPGLTIRDALERFADIRADLDIVEAYEDSDKSRERYEADEARERAQANADTAAHDSDAAL